MQHTGDGRKRVKQHTDPNDPELDWENTNISPVYSRGRKKLIRDRKNTPTRGTTLNARPTTEDDPNVITVVDQNGNTDLIKSENIESNETKTNKIYESQLD